MVPMYPLLFFSSDIWEVGSDYNLRECSIVPPLERAERSPRRNTNTKMKRTANDNDEKEAESSLRGSP